MKAGVKQISEITGFSPATVSNALNQKKGVSRKASDEVFRVAKELGYFNTNTINKIRLVIYKQNGLIIDDTPFFSLLIDGIEQECRASGYEMLITNLDARNTGYREQAIQIINEPGAAIVLLGTELSPDELKLFNGAQCPILLLDYWSIDMTYNAVLINNDDSVRKAVNYLFSKGHRNIGHLGGKFKILGFKQRETGYYSAMREIGLEINPVYTIELGTTMNGAYLDMLDYLNKKPAPRLPTAFFADNDMIALGAMKALLEKGYKIPEDISIIGFDDLPFCEISSPRLTSLRVPKQEMGRLAVRKIIDMIKGNDNVHVKIQVCTEFIERDSVRDISQAH